MRYLLNLDLSTAKAPPAGTANLSAVLIINESNVLNSSCKRPAALSLLIAPKLLLHTIHQSHLYGVLDLNESGLISINLTDMPEFAICHASVPARPAPITITSFI